MTDREDAPGHGHARGIVLMMLAWSLFPVMDAISKVISDDYLVPHIVWSRFFFQSLAGIITAAVW